MTGLIVGAFMAGLLGSPHCVGMCGGFASVCARTLRGSVAWHAGRLTTYALLGALSGFAGRLMPGPPWVALVLSALLLVWFAGVLAGVVPQGSVAGSRIARAGASLIQRTDVPSRYGFGLVTGLLPCGLVYAALGFAIATGSIVGGSLAMLAFGLATIPVLAFLSGVVQRFVRRGLWQRRAVAVAVLLVGLWTLGTRAARTGNPSVHRGALPHAAPLHHP